MGEFEFWQRSEFRRNDDNDPKSSFNDSISSDGSLIRKQKLVSRLISLGDDETSEVSRLNQDNENPGKACRINVGNVRKRRTRNKISSKMKKDSPEEVDLQKGETSAHDHGPLNELKIFMQSLLKDLRVTREFIEMDDKMQHLVGDLSRKPGHGDDKVQLQKRKKSRKDQHHDKFIQVQVHTDLQQQNNSQEKIRQQMPIRDEENNSFEYVMDRSLLRFPTGATVPGSTDYLNALGDRLGSGKFAELITSSKRKGDSLSISAVKPNHQTSVADQNVQVQSNISVVLATEAQKTQGGSLKRNARGKKTVDLGDHHHVPEDQASHGQAMGTAVAYTNVFNPFGQAPWSKYPILPTFLTEPIAANQGPNASVYNYVLPRFPEMKSCMNLERVNQMLEPGSNPGSFPFIPPEETTRRFTLTGPRTEKYGFH